MCIHLIFYDNLLLQNEMLYPKVARIHIGACVCMNGVEMLWASTTRKCCAGLSDPWGQESGLVSLICWLPVTLETVWPKEPCIVWSSCPCIVLSHRWVWACDWLWTMCHQKHDSSIDLTSACFSSWNALGEASHKLCKKTNKQKKPHNRLETDETALGDEWSWGTK